MAAAPQFYIERTIFDNPDDWKSNKGDSINKPASEFFEASSAHESSVMLVTNGSTQAWGGALVSRKRGVPSYNGKKLNWMVWRMEFRFPSQTVENTARHELDIKVCVKTRPSADVKIRNVANFSTQWNADTGQFQIDLDPPAWVDTGFIVPVIAPDVWHTIEYRFWFDEVNTKFSVLSIQLDNQLYMIPENLQGVLMSLTNWEEVASQQIQNELYAPKSTVDVEYRNGILCWSDQRITMIPPEALLEKREREFWWPRGAKGTQELVGGTFDPFGEGASPLERLESKADLRQ